MTLSRSALVACLLSCLAANALALSEAVYACPDSPRMRTCAPTGCALQYKGRTSHLVCAKCLDEKAYVLVNGGTRKATCECAAGYAGKGQDGLCKKCPAGTDIAEGGPVSKSVCLKCPKGSYADEQGTDCLCPAGHYRVVADQPAGYKRIACNPCSARAAYIEEDGHTYESCSMCKAPQVANAEHTACVDAEDADAAPPGDGVVGAVTKRAVQTPLGSLAQAFEEGRQQGQQERIMRMEARAVGAPVPTSPFKAFVDRIRSRRQDKKAEKLNPEAGEAEAEEEEQEEEEPKKLKADVQQARSKSSRDEDADEEREVERKSSKKEQRTSSPKDKSSKSETPYKVDPHLAETLIPGMPSEEAMTGVPPPAPSPAPSGPVTLKDLAKKVGGALGATAPTRNVAGNALGMIDPEALADAGLPPVNNLGALMGALVKKQFGELELDDWKYGVRGRADK